MFCRLPRVLLSVNLEYIFSLSSQILYNPSTGSQKESENNSQRESLPFQKIFKAFFLRVKSLGQNPFNDVFFVARYSVLVSGQLCRFHLEFRNIIELKSAIKFQAFSIMDSTSHPMLHHWFWWYRFFLLLLALGLV